MSRLVQPGTTCLEGARTEAEGIPGRAPAEVHPQPACHRPLRRAATAVPLPRALPHSPPGSLAQGAVVGARGPAGLRSTDRSEGSGFTGVAQGPRVTSSAPRHMHEDTQDAAAAAASRAQGEVSWGDPQGACWAFCRVSVQG